VTVTPPAPAGQEPAAAARQEPAAAARQEPPAAARQEPPAAARQEAPAPAPPGPAVPRPVSPDAAAVWRRWRLPLALVALILLAGSVIALLQPAQMITGYLDPAGTDAAGSHALADILTERGDTVIRATTPAAAETAARAAGPGGVELIVTSPRLLTASQLAGLAGLAADRVLIGPDPAAVAALAPGVGLVGPAPVQALAPGCALPAARLAGTADLGGLRMSVLTRPRAAARAGTRLCYPTGGYPSLIRYNAAGRSITVLGTGNPLTNGSLARLGNAALALNLLAGRPRIVWLVPEPGPPGAGQGGGQAAGSGGLLGLIPAPAYLVALQLAVAVLLAALWRARRFGPLIPEPLPTVVRASETVEGHARLYRSRRARGRAAATLREAMLARTRPALGLAPDAAPGQVAAAFSARSGSGQARIEAMLFGPAPADDAALVALADDLDALEREVRRQ
jgi:hypothetical protein